MPKRTPSSAATPGFLLSTSWSNQGPLSEFELPASSFDVMISPSLFPLGSQDSKLSWFPSVPWTPFPSGSLLAHVPPCGHRRLVAPKLENLNFGPSPFKILSIEKLPDTPHLHPSSNLTFFPVLYFHLYLSPCGYLVGIRNFTLSFFQGIFLCKASL